MRAIKWIKRASVLGIHKVKSLKPADVNETIIIAGSPRSGTTWLGELIQTAAGVTMMFEPLHIDKVLEAKSAGFARRTFLRKGEEWPEGEAFLRRVLAGKVVNRHTIRHNSPMRALTTQRLAVKFIRANGMLEWIHRKFPRTKMVVIVRHPCAVVASLIKARDWFPRKAPPDWSAFLRIVPTFRPVLRRLKTMEEVDAALWCVENYFTFFADKPHPWRLLFYEDLVLNGPSEVTSLFDYLSLDLPKDIYDGLRLPSATARPGYQPKEGFAQLTKWREVLTKEQTERVMNVVEAFGINFYKDDVTPARRYVKTRRTR